MALTVTERPLGHKIIDNGNSFTIFNSAGDAGFTDSLSLTTGDYIYISGYVENYNGFWYVDKSGGIVYLKANADADRVDFIVEANVTVFTTEDHGWNCAHLPIVYKLESNLFPINSVDTIVTITPYGFVGNYFAVQHSALTGGDALFDLDFVAIDDGSDTPFIVQVVDVQSTTITVLNFDGTTPGSSLISMQKYRNNYHALVKVYAGLEPSHPWASQKPYELAVTLKLIPDANNECMFSVNEILKSYLEIRNNDLLATLPNNIDFFTEFYITTQEAYDVSNGTDITVHYETENVDSFEGYAANAMLEFKNLYSGYLSDYVLEEAKFLTLFTTPTIFVGKPFDISFINVYEDDITLVIKKYIGDDFTEEAIVYPNTGVGIIRAFIEGDAQYDRYCVQAIIDGGFVINSITDDLNEKETFTNVNVPPGGISWIIGPQVTLNGASNQTSQNLAILVTGVFVPGNTYAITYTVSSSLAWLDTGITLNVFDSSDNVLDTVSFTGITGGAGSSVSRTHTFIFPSGGDKYGISINRPPTATGSSVYTLTSITATETVFEEDFNITEELCLNINSKCSNQELYLTWLNNLGGLEYWNFTDGSDYLRNIGETGETKQNIFQNWPESYSKTADTIRKQTFRETSKGVLVRSQNLTLDELEVLEYIKSSILVEIVYARGDKRRVLVDTNSWVSYRDIDKLYTLSFTLDFTDDIPAQRL